MFRIRETRAIGGLVSQFGFVYPKTCWRGKLAAQQSKTPPHTLLIQIKSEPRSLHENKKLSHTT